MIEVVRGIEKSTNVRLKNIEQLLLSLVGEVKTPGDNPDEYMHISQVQELLERSKQLEQEARENREKAGKLQTIFESCAHGLITDFEAVRLTVETVEG